MVVNAWEENCLRSEVELSRALGGEPTDHEGFVHVLNRAVPWGGDFNRVVAARLDDLAAFDDVLARAERVHRDRGLDSLDRIDVLPPALDDATWSEPLSARGWRSETVLFFCAPVRVWPARPGLALREPDPDEYLGWYHHRARERDYYDEGWFQAVRPLMRGFAVVFRPRWLEREGEVVASVYSAHLGCINRLFELEVEEGHRARGLGRALLEAVAADAAAQGAGHVILQSGERLRPFYESCGFEECARLSVLRRRSASNPE